MFEVYGFDVILDAELKPMLLEVNVLPSLSSSSELDKKIKTALMCDTFNLIGVVPYRRKQFEKETNQKNWEKFTGLNTAKPTQPDQPLDEKPATYLQRDYQQPVIKLRTGKEIQAETDPRNYNREEQLVVIELVEEYTRRGQFDLVFPRASNVDHYKRYF